MARILSNETTAERRTRIDRQYQHAIDRETRQRAIRAELDGRKTLAMLDEQDAIEHGVYNGGSSAFGYTKVG